MFNPEGVAYYAFTIKDLPRFPSLGPYLVSVEATNSAGYSSQVKDVSTAFAYARFAD